MTALKKFDRIEAAGLWRERPDAQRVEVIVSVGDATLVITNMRDMALAHWSLPAVERANPGQVPAIFHPDGVPEETLELGEDAAEMIEAIETLRSAIARRRPRPGRLRLMATVSLFAAIGALGVFWLPEASLQHALKVVPQVKRAEIGNGLLKNIRRVAGAPCSAPQSVEALARLGARLPAPHGGGRLVVVRSGIEVSTHLPGGTVILGRALVEDYEEPDVVAGYIIAERLRAQITDPLEPLLREAGLVSTFRLLLTGALSEGALQEYAETLLRRAPAPLPDSALLAGFDAWAVRATPYALAVDITGDSTAALIENDPYRSAAPAPVITDGDWLRLQVICGG